MFFPRGFTLPIVAAGLAASLTSCGVSPVESQLDSVTGTIGANSIDYNRTTRIIAVGYSHGQGSQFIEAALGRAQKYREIFPNDQIVLMGNPEVNSRTNDRTAFERYGIKVTEYRPNEYLKSSTLIGKMLQFSTIASFDYYGHSSPWSIGVSPKGMRFGTDSKRAALRRLAKRLTGDAYATLNGCNAALYLAPFLSDIWKVPVSAAATATNFQKLHSDGNWYVNDPGHHPEGPWAKRNDVSFDASKRCNRGYCLRLIPENAPYSGYWGSSKAGGLGFLKFFCKNHKSMKECKRRMALSTLAYPTLANTNLESSKSEFQKATFDFLCPNDKTGRRTRQCKTGILEAIDRGDMVYSGFRGNELRCDFNGCKFDYACKKDGNGNPLPGTCKLSAPKNRNPKNTAREFVALMEGFDELQRVGLKGGYNNPGDYHEPTNRSTYTRKDLESAAMVEVQVTSLNCRTSASLSSDVVEVLSGGDTLRITADRHGEKTATDSRGVHWARVTSSTGEACYVSGKTRLISLLSL